MEKVSIIIPTYNCQYVDQAIESALGQTYPNVEVVVVNDNSTLYNEKISPYYNVIRYIEKGHTGTAGTLNMGYRAATGDYLTWLSADDLYLPEKTEKQLKFMLHHNADVCYSNYHLINEHGEITHQSVGSGFSSRLELCQRMLIGCTINGCTVMMKRNVFRHLGPFDEQLQYTHDYDLWLRIIKHYNLLYFPEPYVMYRVHENMTTKKEEKKIPAEIRQVINRHKLSLKMLIRKEMNS
ncbi:glycosyltransferase [Fodinisporobacter ferrooxydans]|uniref:Glycosyltransferase n=1 Tax=Fodinisporobacter ferrooxydans TaxID=2901836 RepID=A0ABY4CLS5_9BACL|nr:glycosyltransferase [Alicyclobacillaceae bacterium MYW30-H2]